MMIHLRPALVLVALFTVVTGLAFPIAFVGAAGLVFPWQAGGSLIERDGKVIGSALLGQSFTQDKYVQGRPSATTDADPADSSKTVPAPYNAGSSNASNAGPTAKSLIDRVTADLERAGVDKVGAKPIPGDMLTTSASGLDPDISPATAERQVARIAVARRMPEARVRALFEQHTSGRLLGLIGEPRVNVLALNLALDQASTGAPPGVASR
ncbi:MAG: K(+)-transporting ATPase subunit C [Acetobacteraceae bacterium]